MRAIVLACFLLATTSAAADPLRELVTTFGNAVGSGDENAIAATLFAPLRYERLHFDEDRCNGFFGSDGVVQKKWLQTFAVCLTTLSDLKQTEFLADPNPSATFPVDPAHPFQLRLWKAAKSAKIVRIALIHSGQSDEPQAGGVADRAPPPDQPPSRPATAVPMATLEPLRIAGAWPGKREGTVVTIAKVCFDAAGAVESVDFVKGSGVLAWDKDVRRALMAWKIRPYHSADRPDPIRVCTLGRFAQP